MDEEELDEPTDLDLALGDEDDDEEELEEEDELAEGFKITDANGEEEDEAV